jgi:hypothetical protein
MQGKDLGMLPRRIMMYTENTIIAIIGIIIGPAYQGLSGW